MARQALLKVSKFLVWRKRKGTSHCKNIMNCQLKEHDIILLDKRKHAVVSPTALSVSVFSRNLISQLRKLFSTNREMSILTYFTRTALGQSTESIVLPSREESGVLSTEYDCIVKEVQNGPPAKRKRTTYREDE